ncbi:hypothetical protein [Geodermatophilus chilensis]|uniref:hypothetical protein n=1 Tax=Geodermatophilus chilensis TaxID=2035835 RepID=UPI000C25A8C9|nr:hypothetical protein [Geodermatophilus chilensis]
MSTVDTTHTPADAVAAVQQLADDRDRLLGLLADVLAGHVQTSCDDTALILLSAEALDGIRAALETRCATCGELTWRPGPCDLCTLGQLDASSAA